MHGQIDKKWEFSTTLQQTALPSFSSNLAQLQSQYPHVVQTTQQDSQNYESVQSLINYITVAYVLLNIIKTYKQLYIMEDVENNDSALLKSIKKFVVWVSPNYLIAFGKQGKFLVHAIAITLNALVYKTIVKLVLYTMQGDLIDAVEKVTMRLIRLIKTITNS